MVILAKLLIGIFIALSADSLDTYTSIESNNEQAELYVSNYIIRNPRDKAFQILDNKCNVCHSKLIKDEYSQLKTWMTSRLIFINRYL